MRIFFFSYNLIDFSVSKKVFSIASDILSDLSGSVVKLLSFVLSCENL